MFPVGARNTTNRDLIVVGASAGGVEALRCLVAGLPPDLPAAVLAVLHLPAGGTSALASILDRAGALPVRPAENDVPLKPGTVAVAVPDHHLLVENGRTLLTNGPTESGHRPAINALFRSAALDLNGRVTGVVLSGMLDDGAAGLAAIAAANGRTVVQSPDDALYSSMPESALRAVAADHVVTLDEMGEVLTALAAEPAEGEEHMQPDVLVELENRIARGNDMLTRRDHAELGVPSGFVCPDCSGSLLDLGAGRYRCYVGHAWTEEALLRARGHELERALWTALRTLDEEASLARRMAERAGASPRSQPSLRGRYERAAAEAAHAADVLRSHLGTVYSTAGTSVS
ncbi:chemotaxis protein CheB [Prauserella sp. ASG 168]|uniref:protein-glutamate methylesterase n=2 Tax=Prauserella cavernicola TaxID=2800127 RepID=A0A934QMR6_9PSEU|nr:chemotaxis protein CheB [Prauserella cavernicola]